MVVRKYFAAMIVVMLATFAVGQEIKHALTIQQCRADAKLWGTESNNQEVSYLTLQAVLSRLQCWLCAAVFAGMSKTGAGPLKGLGLRRSRYTSDGSLPRFP